MVQFLVDEGFTVQRRQKKTPPIAANSIRRRADRRPNPTPIGSLRPERGGIGAEGDLAALFSVHR
jgi:hypothetical protein